MGLKKLIVLLLSVIIILISSKVICEEAKTGLYNAATVNLRTWPSTKSFPLGLENKNTTCQILSKQLI